MNLAYVIVPVPPQPAATQILQVDAFSFYDETNPYIPRPGGRFEVSNALVDRNNGIGAWSVPSTIITDSGWSLWGNVYNQPVSYDALAVAWRIRCVEVDDERSGIKAGMEMSWCVSKKGQGPLSIASRFPWGRLTPRYERLVNGEMYYPISKLRHDGSHTAVAPAPSIICSQLSNVKAQIAFAWKFNEGMGPLSQPLSVEPFGAGAFVERVLRIQNAPVPIGAIGYCLYAKYHGETMWRKCAHESEVYQIDNYNPIISRTLVSAYNAIYDTAVVSEIIINPVNHLLSTTNGDIDFQGAEVPLDQPIIDMWGAAKEGRKISNLVLKVPPTVDANFPGLLVQNKYSQFNRVFVNGENTNLKCGLAFSDFSGGQSFSNEFNSCRFQLDQTGRNGRCTAMRVREECSGVDHSASEITFNRCEFAGTICLWIEHKQTCNLIFRDCKTASFVDGDRLNYGDGMIWSSTPNRVTFDGILHGDCPGGTAFNIEEGDIKVEHLFIDKGCVSLVDFTGYKESKLSIEYLAANFNRYATVQHHEKPANLLRMGNGTVGYLHIRDIKAGVVDLSVSANGHSRVLTPFEVKNGTTTVLMSNTGG